MDLVHPNQPKVLLVVRAFIRAQDDKLLFIQRSFIDPRHPGLWECPGGKVDLDLDEDMASALLREVREETGLIVECLHASAFVDGYLIQDGKYEGMQYEAHFNVCVVTDGTLKLSHEHEALRWLTHAESLDLDLTPEVRAAAIALREHLV